MKIGAQKRASHFRFCPMHSLFGLDFGTAGRAHFYAALLVGCKIFDSERARGASA